MNNPRPIPISLQIVALLFLLGGLCSLIGTIIRLTAGFINIDCGFLGIPTYFGLRRLSLGWRTFALVCLWLGLIVSPILFIFGLFSHAPGDATLFGFHFAQVAPIWLSVVSVPMFLLELWQYRVLTHPKIRPLFFETEIAP